MNFNRLQLLRFAFSTLGLLGCCSGCSVVKPQLANLKSLAPASQPQPAASALNIVETNVPTNHRDALQTEFDICLEIARLADQRGMDEEAMRQYQRARELKPDHAGLAHPLAVLHDRNGQTDAAQREYERALKEQPRNADVLCDYGYFLYTRGDLVKSEEKLRQALAKNTSHRQAQINLGLVLGSRGQYAEAQQLFTAAIGPAAAKHNVGMLKLRAGDQAGGKSDLQAAAAADPSLDRTRSVLAQIN